MFVRQPRVINHTDVGNASPPLAGGLVATDSLRKGLVAAYCPSLTLTKACIAADLSGYNNHGRLVEDFRTAWQTSGGKRALNVAYSSIIAPYSPKTEPRSGEFSISGWFSTGTKSTVNHLIRRDYGTGAVSRTAIYVGVESSGYLRWVIQDNTAVINSVLSPNTVTDNKWHHAVGVRSGSSHDLWLDGILVASISRTTGDLLGNPSADWYIGLWSGQPSFLAANNFDATGYRDDIRIYSRALTPKEISVLYSGGNGRGIGLSYHKSNIINSSEPYSSINGTTSVLFNVDGSIFGSGYLNGETSINISTNAGINGLGKVDSSTSLNFDVNASLNGSGNILSNDATLIFSGSASILADGMLEGSTDLTFFGAATVDGVVAADTDLTFIVSGDLTGIGDISGNSSITFTASADITGDGDTSGETSLSFECYGAVVGNGILDGDTTLIFVPTGEIFGNSVVHGPTSITFAANATVNGDGVISGQCGLTFGSTGSIINGGEASGGFNITFNATGSLDGLPTIGKRQIYINMQLEVRGNNKVLIPGCEPSSSLSSRTLSAYMAAGKGCKNALIDLNDALMAIPGSYVKFGSNFNTIRKKWYVLPPIDSNCPCTSYEDYYRILRNIPGSEIPITEEYDKCDLVGMGYCPSPDFDEMKPPPSSTYTKEGTFPTVGGVLPPVPPWAID